MVDEDIDLLELEEKKVAKGRVRIASTEEAYYGKEPDPKNFPHPAAAGFALEIGNCFNWYNYAVTNEKKKKWFLEWLKSTKYSHLAVKYDLLKDNRFHVAGMLARLISRGLKNSVLVNSSLSKAATELLKDAQRFAREKGQKTAPVEERKVVVNPVDVKLTTAEIQLRNVVEDCMQNEYRSSFNMSDFLANHRLNPDQHSELIGKYQIWLDEVINTDLDPELEEAYQHLSRREKTRFIDFLSMIVNTEAPVRNTEGKPRKQRKVSPEKLIRKLRYLKEYPELKLSSIDALDVLGATSLVTYDTDSRNLFLYHASPGLKLSVHRSNIINFDEKTSVKKKLRKPEEVLPEVKKSRNLDKVFEKLTTTAGMPNGRTNENMILLKVL